MKVVIAPVPQGVIVVNMQRIGSLSGIKDGPWKKICDYLLFCPVDDGEEAIFVELKRNLSDGSEGKEQLRRSLPYLDYLRSLCRIEYGRSVSPKRMSTRYAVIAEKTSPRLAKQSVSGGHFASVETYRDIAILRLVGKRLRFEWLARGK